MAGPHRITITMVPTIQANGDLAGCPDTFAQLGVQSHKDKAVNMLSKLAGAMQSGTFRFGQVDIGVDDSNSTPASQTVTYSASGGAQTITVAGTQVNFTAGANDTATAVAAIAAIRANVTTNRLVRASNAAGVLTLKANAPPVIAAMANGMTLAATGTGSSVGGATFAGGVNATDTGYSL